MSVRIEGRVLPFISLPAPSWEESGEWPSIRRESIGGLSPNQSPLRAQTVPPSKQHFISNLQMDSMALGVLIFSQGVIIKERDSGRKGLDRSLGLPVQTLKFL